MLLPHVAELPQDFRGVIPASRLIDANRMKFGTFGILFGKVAVAPYDAATISHDPYQAAMLPVTDLFVVRALEQP